MASRKSPQEGVPEGTLCAVCQKRPATQLWGSRFEAAHFGYECRCLICTLEPQVEHARERAAALPGLERALTAAREADG